MKAFVQQQPVLFVTFVTRIALGDSGDRPIGDSGDRPLEVLGVGFNL